MSIAHSGAITMTSSPQKTLLCITSYEKGQEFIRECKRQGAYVILLTVTALENANWPRESIDELYYMPDLSKTGEVIRAVSFLSQSFDVRYRFVIVRSCNRENIIRF